MALLENCVNEKTFRNSHGKFIGTLPLYLSLMYYIFLRCNVFSLFFGVLFFNFCKLSLSIILSRFAKYEVWTALNCFWIVLFLSSYRSFLCVSACCCLSKKHYMLCNKPSSIRGLIYFGIFLISSHKYNFHHRLQGVLFESS